jgi:hypothetical protein
MQAVAAAAAVAGCTAAVACCAARRLCWAHAACASASSGGSGGGISNINSSSSSDEWEAWVASISTQPQLRPHVRSSQGTLPWHLIYGSLWGEGKLEQLRIWRPIGRMVDGELICLFQVRVNG